MSANDSSSNEKAWRSNQSLLRRDVLRLAFGAGTAMMLSQFETGYANVAAAPAHLPPRTLQPSIVDPDSIVPAAIQAYAQGTDTPGVAAALIYNGQPYFYNYGLANLADSNSAVTSDTIFEIGSVTKVFTATMLAYNMVQNGVQFQDRVTNYLPSLGNSVGNITQVTMGDLVTHTSGLPRSGGGSQASYYLFNELSPTDTLHDFWRTWKGTPGQCWLYSNIGFVTLGFAVGLVKNKTGKFINQYNELLHENITKPLGMVNTAAYIQAPGGPVAQGYLGSAATTTRVWSIAADLKTTAQDMSNFMQAELGVTNPGKTLAPVIYLTQQPVPNAPTIQCGSTKNTKFVMGMAWQITNAGQTNEILAKDGATGLGGFLAYVALMPNRGMGITLLANKKVSGKVTTTINQLGLNILSALHS